MFPEKLILNNQKTPAAARLSYWLRLTRGPIFVSIVTSTLTFVAIVLLYRQLNSEDAGTLTIILALIQLTMMVAGLGQPTLIQRMYSRSAESEFNWPKDLLISTAASLPLSLLICIIAYTIYELTILRTVLVFLSATMQIAILTQSQMLNASQLYVWGNTLLRLPNSLLIFPVLVILLVPTALQLDTFLKLFTTLTAIVALFGLILLIKHLHRGRRAIGWRARFNGVIFLFTQSSYSLPDQGIVAIAASILTSSQLAIYGAIAILQKPFELLTSVLRTIFTTELIRQRDQNRALLNTGVWGISVLALALAIFFGPEVVRFLYAGRYAQGTALIPALALAGFFRLVETVPRSFVIGNANQHGLRRFVSFQLIVAGVILVACWWMILENGVIALAWSITLVQLSRYLVSREVYRSTEMKSK